MKIENKPEIKGETLGQSTSKLMDKSDKKRPYPTERNDNQW